MGIELDAFRAEILKKLGGLTIDQWQVVRPGEHLWGLYRDAMACGLCSIVLRKDGDNEPCSGSVNISTRGGG